MSRQHELKFLESLGPITETPQSSTKKNDLAFPLGASVVANDAGELKHLAAPGRGLKKGEVSMGTSIMAVAFNGGVVIAADSRTSSGDYVSNRVSDKLSAVSDRIYCARSGSAADTQAIADMATYYLELHSIELAKDPSVAVAARLFGDVIYSNKERLLAGIIVAGWDAQKGGAVWSVSLGGAVVQQPFAIGGSGSTYIYGWCDANFKAQMTRAECQLFVRRGLSHAMARDGSSGGLIRMITIDQKGAERNVIEGDKLDFMI